MLEMLFSMEYNESHDNESESDYKGHPMLVRQVAYIYDGTMGL